MLSDDANDSQRTDEGSVNLEPLGTRRLFIGAGAIVLLTALGVVGAVLEVAVGAPSSIDGYRVDGD